MTRGAAKRELGEIDPCMIQKMRKRLGSNGNGNEKRAEIVKRFRRAEASRTVIQNVIDVIHQSPAPEPDRPQHEEQSS